MTFSQNAFADLARPIRDFSRKPGAKARTVRRRMDRATKRASIALFWAL